VEYPLLGIESGKRPQLLVLSGGRGVANPAVNHFSLGVDNFDVDAIVKVLKEHNVPGRVRMREGKTQEILFNDPDGNLFQIQHVSYCGGSGPLGDNCDPKVRPFPKSAPGGNPPARPPLPARTLNSFAISAINMQRSLDFYQKLFAMPILTYQGNTALLTLGTGPRPQFVAISQGEYRDGKLVTAPSMTANSRLTHFCLGIENFDPDRVIKTLAAEGVKGEVKMREGKTPEVYFWDPDNIRVQIQDVSYCGGSGPLGNLCDEKTRPLADAKQGVQR
jgi:catechol 2,3-dioxygenase-like lactoylglutathione lyase family enzyme